MQQNDFAKLNIFLQNQSDKNPVIFDSGDGSKLTVLHVSAALGNLDIIKGYKDIIGIENLNPIDDNNKTPLFAASYFGHFHVVQFYMENGYKASSKIASLQNQMYNFAWKKLRYECSTSDYWTKCRLIVS